MGKVVLISVPIGNLLDITERARYELSTLKAFAVEDTRSFQSLMALLGIDLGGRKVISFHDHSKESGLPRVRSIIEEYGEIGVVSEAGSPIISDPAYPIVKMALELNYDLVSVPGVTSLITALELSGLPSTPFHYHGFFPRDKRDQENFFRETKEMGGTHILFESPHRIADSVTMIASLGPELDIVIARELTKKFETIYRFKGSEWERIRENFIQKGEMVLLFSHGKSEKKSFDEKEIVRLSKEIIDQGVNLKTLSKLLAKIVDQGVSEIYQELSKKKR